jgi:hypothetical protein
MSIKSFNKFDILYISSDDESETSFIDNINDTDDDISLQYSVSSFCGKKRYRCGKIKKSFKKKIKK